MFEVNKCYHLGYVPRYYSKELTELLKDNIEYSAMVQSLNFESKISDEDISVVVKLIFNWYSEIIIITWTNKCNNEYISIV